MSIIGKIQSLFSDREKTQPIFPITKTKAVSDDNGVGLDALLDNINVSIKKATPVNLLDNSDFRNPVNQRNVTGTSGRLAYTIDRWYIDSTTGKGYFDTKPGIGIGMNVNGDSWMTFSQNISGMDSSKTYTIAFKDGNGNIHINEYSDMYWNDNLATVRIILQADTRTVVWVALYEGEYTAETLPEYRSKGYGAELAECQRYYLKISHDPLGTGYTIGAGNAALIIIPTPVAMRIAPSLEYTTDDFYVRVNGADYPAKSPTVGAVRGNNCVHLSFADCGVPGKYPASCYKLTGEIALSADL